MSGGNCPGGTCPGGLCPRTVFSAVILVFEYQKTALRALRCVGHLALRQLLLTSTTTHMGGAHYETKGRPQNLFELYA